MIDAEAFDAFFGLLAGIIGGWLLWWSFTPSTRMQGPQQTASRNDGTEAPRLDP